MNLQELFNKAVKRLAAQGFERSLREGEDVCLYRGVNGHRCLVGHLIPDKLYATGMDATPGGMDVVQLLRKYPEVKPYILPDNMGLDRGATVMAYAQSCHDEGQTPDYMREYLTSFAKAQGLELPPELQ